MTMGQLKRWFLFSLALLTISKCVHAQEESTCVDDGNNESCTLRTNLRLLQEQRDPTPCSLYMSKSQLGGIGIYTAVDIPKHASILGNAGGELVIPMVDANLNEWALWQAYFWGGDLMEDVLMENEFDSHIFIPGIGTTIQCHSVHANVAFDEASVESHPEDWAHRSNSSTAGAYTYRYNYTNMAMRDIHAGEELLLWCNQESPTMEQFDATARKSVEVLEAEGAVCLSRLVQGVSTIPGAGRGAFAAQAFPEDSVVTKSPVIHVDKYQLDIHEQYWKQGDEDDEGRTMFTKNKIGTQLLMNYCFGRNNSDLLLLPVGSMVNYINHDAKEPNVAVRWPVDAKARLQPQLDMPAYDLLSTMKGMEIEYVALRDIELGDELFLDYGEQWGSAWAEHQKTWAPQHGSAEYVSASEYVRIYASEQIRTDSEQRKKPYPDNVMTACYFQETEQDVNHLNSEGRFVWRDENNGCLRPCVILDRFRGFYTARMQAMESHSMPDWCSLSGDHMEVTAIPASVVRLLDRPYTSDVHLKNAFRHVIEAPEGLYPHVWMNHERRHDELVGRPELKRGEIAPMTIDSTGEPVADYAHVIDIPKSVTDSLMEYCDRMGITEKFRSLIVDGNPLQPGSDEYVDFGGYNWYTQRPNANWRSNMHWISPADERSHIDYLRALGAGGFDELLKNVGEYFGLNGLVVYHLTFIGVNHCSEGYSHHDFHGAGGKAWNMIIPLILANQTGPELDVSSDSFTAGYKYEIGAASMVGDDAYHATAACDYRGTGEMRMAATVYMADVDEMNIDSIVNDFTQAYPTRGDTEYVLSRAGSHWKRDDPSKRLPEPLPPSDFLETNLEPGQIAPIMMDKGHDMNVEHVFRIGLSDTLIDTLLRYAERMGIKGKVFDLLKGHELAPDRDQNATFKGYNWLIQRPPEHWNSNMHWISPSDESAHEDFLRTLSQGGFDDVLQNIGTYFGYDGLVAYHLTFIAVSHCQKGYVHYDIESIGGQMFNVIVPLILATETGPELEILDEESNLLGGYKYEDGVAIMVGDSAMHATGAVDYRYTGEVRLAATIYIADANEANAAEIMSAFTQAYPRSGDTQFLLDRAASHWKKGDPSKRLPIPIGDFSGTPLKPNEISQITWASNGEPVADYAFRVGLPERLRQALLAYTDRIGITEKYRSLEIYGHPLEPGHSQYLQFGGHNWFIQRPPAHWHSNMHWISPADDSAQTDYLKALSAGGFDEVLESLGRRFDLDGLSCYHITFIAVSKCESGYMHHDFSGVDGKAFNLIIPMILVNETGPELDILSNDGNMIGGYRYEYNVASAVGDNAGHATAECDYSGTDEMRMAATIYMADINEQNVQGIVDDFTQAYPPRDVDFLMARAGNHWSRTDTSRRLPNPDAAHLVE